VYDVYVTQERDEMKRITKKRTEAVKEFFSILTGSPLEDVSVSWTEKDSSVAKTEGGWVVKLSSEDELPVLLHEASHILYTPFDVADVAGVSLSDERVRLMTNIIEDARIDWLGGEWFGKDLFLAHKEMLEKEVGDGKAKNLHHAVGSLVYDLGLTVEDSITQAAMVRFENEILTATRSRDSMAAVEVAFKIARYMDWLKEREEEKRLEEESHRKEEGDAREALLKTLEDVLDRKVDGDEKKGEESKDEGGELSSNDNEDEDNNESSDDESKSDEDEESGDDITGGESDDEKGEEDEGKEGSEGGGSEDEGDKDGSEDNDRANDSSDGGSDSDAGGEGMDNEGMDAAANRDAGRGSGTEGSGGEFEGGGKSSDEYSESGEEERTERLLKEMKTKVKEDVERNERMDKTTKRILGKKEKLFSPKSSPDHAVENLTVEQEPINLSSKMMFTLDETADLVGSRRVYTGFPTTEVWRLNYGSTKVFARPPIKRGRLVVMVDLSSSMGCWCDRHNLTEYKSSGWLAFQVVGALATRFPEITVFGFCASGVANFIVPLEHNHQPKCRNLTGIPSGNPDCAALLYLESILHGSLEGTRAVVISDGTPDGPYPLKCNSTAHTTEIAHRLHDSGLRYVSVLVNTSPSNIYPSDLVVNINDEDELENIAAGLEYLEGR